MKDDIRAHLHDIRQAACAVKDFVVSKTFDDYIRDDLLQSAVERKFEVMGEALTRIRRDDPESLATIREQRKIISFRNILIHGYDTIDDRIVWDVIKDDLDCLIEDAERLLATPNSKPN